MKKLVFCSNSIPRMNFMDKYMFKDLFNGEVIIVTDDRVRNQKSDYLKAQQNWTNENLKNAKILALKEDGLYDNYLKETEVNSSVSMTIKKKEK